jgi:ADP-ribose pyrophosphatase YjhB (NUDIX family)
MDGLSVLYALSPAINAELYKQGNAHGWLAKSAAPVASHYLAGRLYMAKSGWLLLSVPNALVRGVFDAMTDAGVELPRAGVLNVPNVDKELLNAHISVMTAEEAEKIGAGNINERGHSFRYSLGPVKEITPKNIDGVSKIWAIQVSSPDLSALRKSYGLSAFPKDEPFHITVAVRRAKVLGNNAVSKGYETSAESTGGHSFRNPISRGELKAAAHEGAPWDTPVDKLPWRERVEVYAHDPKGRIYGGIWNTDKSFAVPGGGIDPGEDPGQAAIRELEEETGIKATNARVLPIAPVDNAWSDKHRQEKQRNFAGSRTHFVAVDILNKMRRKNLDKWDAAQRKMYDPAAAEQMMASHTNFMAPSVAAGRLAALRHIIANAAKKTAAELSRSGQKDLLPGGKADNVPDQEFSPKELAIGAADEHEHTDNDQVAREIAKDHLQEDPQYYEKEKLIQKEAQPAIILKLREAKEHSDNKRYDKKNEILRRLMTQAPDEWFVDDPLPRHMGITHAPTSFRFHADPGIIPTGVKVKAKAASSNPYWDQITNFSQAPVIDKSKSIWQNFFKELSKRTANADRQYDMQQNDHKWRAELIPGYREQMNTAIARGEFPKPNPTAEFLRNTATPALAAVT